MISIKGISWSSTFEAILDKADKIKRGHRFLIFLVVILLVFGGFFYLVYKPKNDEINQINQNIVKLSQNVFRLKKNEQNLPKLEERQAEIQKKFESIRELLPEKREIPDFLEQVSQLGIKSGLEMRLFRPEKEEVKEFYVEIPISIEVGGTYADVAHFIDRLRRMKRIVDVKAFDIREKEAVSAKLVQSAMTSGIKYRVELIATFTILTYRLKNEADEPKDTKGKKK